jgi:thioredoxin family protein
VQSRETPAPIPFRVLVDGEAPGASHGVDVDEDGNSVLRHRRLYQLVRQHDAVRDRTLEITFLEPGAEAYAFSSASGARSGSIGAWRPSRRSAGCRAVLGVS